MAEATSVAEFPKNRERNTAMTQAKAGEPAWMAEARALVGLKEIVGSKHEPRIVQFFADAGHPWVKDDETAWCAAFVNAMLKRAGIDGTGSLAARSFLQWGEKLDKPRVGCIAVFWRGSKNSWQGHVGFYVGEEGSNILVLGGNQGNAVSIAKYPKSRLLGYRWPVEKKPEREIPEQGKITIVNSGSKPEAFTPPPVPQRPAAQIPPSTQYPAAVYRPEIERLQKALKDLGYHEVGLIDGQWGPKTSTALLAFKLDNGLPLTPVVDDLTWMTLARAAPRKVSQAREEATEPPSVAAKAAKGGKVAGGIIGGAGLLDLLLSPFGGIAGVTDFLIGVRDTVGAVQDAASPIRDLGGALASNWQLLTLLAGVALFIVGKYVFDDELQSFKRGEWS